METQNEEKRKYVKHKDNKVSFKLFFFGGFGLYKLTNNSFQRASPFTFSMNFLILYTDLLITLQYIILAQVSLQYRVHIAEAG